MMPSAQISQRIWDQIPMGVIVLDQALCVWQWNAWMAQHTGISERDACGKTLMQLFEGFHNPRLTWAVQEVIKHAAPQLISQVFNHYVIPIRLKTNERLGTPFMQQQVALAPLALADGSLRAVVSITDVTENVVRANRIIEAAHKMESASNRDELTGLYNRRFMWDWLGQALKQCTRHGHPLACLMLDLDHCQRLNQQYGHQLCDQVLIEFCHAVQQQLRTSDVMIRYGGDEFVVLLPNCQQSGALLLAQRMLQAVREQSLAQLPPGSVTVSIGLAVWQQMHPLTGVELLSQADRRLFEAKNAGRDQVMAGTLALVESASADTPPPVPLPEPVAAADSPPSLNVPDLAFDSKAE
ncbi:MAG: hypothetical protein RL748_3091 [Pseudomonadota bacterium]|jgi:diguanylate cyclase (GGDEF)-like protein